MSEPLWAQGKSDADLRQVCKVLKVPGYSTMRREELISACTPGSKSSRIRAEDVKNLCLKWNPSVNDRFFTDEDYQKCYADSKLKDIKKEDERVAKSKTCSYPSKVPQKSYDTFNDCPMFYRRGTDPKIKASMKVKPGEEECCFPSRQAKLKAVFRAPVAAKALYNEFLDRFGVGTVEELEEEVQNSKFSSDEKTEIVESYKEDVKDLQLWVEGLNLSKRDHAFMMSVGKMIKDQFAANLKEAMDDLNQIKSGVVDIQQKLSNEQSFLGKLMSKVGSAVGWVAGQVYKVISWSVTTLATLGFNLIRYILTNPRTAKIMAFIALRIKKRICKEVSIYVGMYVYKKESGILDKITEGVASAAEAAKQGLPGIVANFVNGSKFDTLWGSLTDTITSGFSSVLGAVPVISKSVPVVGGLVELGMDIAKESVRFATEVAMYEKDVTGTVGHIIELIDLTECIKVQEVEKQEVEEVEKKAKAIQSLVDPALREVESMKQRGNLAMRKAQEYLDLVGISRPPADDAEGPSTPRRR